MGLEVVEETYMDLHRNLAPTTIVPDPLRLTGHKSVAASIAAAQAVLTNTLSPTSHRKKKSAITNSVGIEALSQPEHYSFSKEVDQIKSLGKIGPMAGKLQWEVAEYYVEKQLHCRLKTVTTNPVCVERACNLRSSSFRFHWQ